MRLDLTDIFKKALGLFMKNRFYLFVRPCNISIYNKWKQFRILICSSDRALLEAADIG